MRKPIAMALFLAWTSAACMRESRFRCDETQDGGPRPCGSGERCLAGSCTLAAAECETGLRYDDYADTPGRCVDCAVLGAPCCADRTCHGSGLACGLDGKCSNGKLGEPCGPGGLCGNTLCCDDDVCGCAPGRAHCGMAPSDMCEVDISRDPQNCGVCGHGCFGGECSPAAAGSSGYPGTCRPFALVSDVGSTVNPRSIAVDPGLGVVYWTVDNVSRVDACSVEGCGTAGPTVVASGEVGAAAVATDGRNVYWLDYAAGAGGVKKCPVSGCPDGGPITLAAESILIENELATNGRDVYWTQADGFVRKCPVSGCPDGGPVTVAAGEQQPWGITLDPPSVDGGNVYWTTHGPTTDGGATGAVRMCPLDGCPDGGITLADNQQTPSDVASDGRRVYWTSGTRAGTIVFLGTVHMCPISGCPAGGPIVIANRQELPYAIAADETYVYWINYIGGEVMRCTASDSGCLDPPSAIASLQGNPVALAVDRDSLYWVTVANRRVMRMAKPLPASQAPSTQMCGP